MNELGPVVIADGDENELAHVASVIRRARFETVEVTTGEEALNVIRADGAGFVVLEVRLPDMTGYELCHAIRSEQGPDLPIFFLSSVRTESLDRVAGLLLGADDFLTKPFEPDELIARMRGLLARTSLPQRPRTLDSRGHGLTPREQEVLSLLAEGRNPKEVASELSISPKTVATHIQHLVDKVGVHSRGELIARSYLLGIVSGLSVAV